MKRKLSPSRPTIGYTDQETVKLDLDKTTFKEVRYWAFRTLSWFKLEGLMILKSSKNNYHVIFDRKVTWQENMHIVAWVCLQSKNEGLKKWFIMQCIKESSTLRVSQKKGKPPPRIVFSFGKQDGELSLFKRWRKMIKHSQRGS